MLLARRILQEYDDSTVDEPAVNPAEFWNFANRTILWKSQGVLEGSEVFFVDSQESCLSPICGHC